MYTHSHHVRVEATKWPPRTVTMGPPTPLHVNVRPLMGGGPQALPWFLVEGCAVALCATVHPDVSPTMVCHDGMGGGGQKVRAADGSAVTRYMRSRCTCIVREYHRHLCNRAGKWDLHTTAACGLHTLAHFPHSMDRGSASRVSVHPLRNSNTSPEYP